MKAQLFEIYGMQAKVVLRGKFPAIKADLKKKRKSQVKVQNLTLNPNELGKEEQTQSKEKEKIMKIGAEIK